MKKSILKLSLLSIICFACFSCDSSENESTAPVMVYEIGEPGPAGGIVFYDKGMVSSGWQYIEVSPEEFPDHQWGCHTVVPGTNDRSIGSGKSNSETIVQFHDDLNDFYNNPEVCSPLNDGTVAAKFCESYSFGGFQDWFLPSSDEVYEMYSALHLNGIGNFDEDALYWSSTEHDEHNAIATDFETSDQGYLCKGCEHVSLIRAVRYF